tara:strand:+ start:294 stop:581 length:288 start_codon:yes stop_codon:yes gene_type:complete
MSVFIALTTAINTLEGEDQEEVTDKAVDSFIKACLAAAERGTPCPVDLTKNKELVLALMKELLTDTMKDLIKYLSKSKDWDNSLEEYFEEMSWKE